jgi:WLM domain
MGLLLSTVKDWSCPGSTITLIVACTTLLAAHVVRMILANNNNHTTTTTTRNRDENYSPDAAQRDAEIRARARDAAAARQNKWKVKANKKKRAQLQHSLPKDGDSKRESQPLDDRAISRTENVMSSSCVDIIAASMPVFDDGITSFRHIPTLPYADQAADLLRLLAKNFVPILRQRGYDVRTVSEFCCCGDGLDYQLGGHAWTVRPGSNIAGHDASNVAGYNRLDFTTRARHDVHSIHLRLRSPHHHDYLITYQDLAANMAHELAHCVHRNHGPAFYRLMKDIEEQHETNFILENLTSTNNN